MAERDKIRLVINGKCVDIKPNLKTGGRKVKSMTDGEVHGSPVCTIILDTDEYY